MQPRPRRLGRHAHGPRSIGQETNRSVAVAAEPGAIASLLEGIVWPYQSDEPHPGFKSRHWHRTPLPPRVQ